MVTNDQNILDVVMAVRRDLKRDASFRALLRTLDDETARKIAARYVEFLYHALELEPPQNGANNNRGGSWCYLPPGALCRISWCVIWAGRYLAGARRRRHQRRLQRVQTNTLRINL